MTCYMIALRRLPTAVVSTYAYVNPVAAVAFGALLLGERLTLSTVLGGHRRRLGRTAAAQPAVLISNKDLASTS